MTESEVQSVLVRWLHDQGYSTSETCEVEGGNRVDVVATSGRGEWRIEVKGDYDSSGAQYNVNFDTGMASRSHTAGQNVGPSCHIVAFCPSTRNP